MKSTWCLIEQLIKKEPEQKVKPKEVVSSTIMVSRLVRKVESSFQLHEAAQIRVALASRAYNERLTLKDIDELAAAARVSSVKLRRIAGI